MARILCCREVKSMNLPLEFGRLVNDGNGIIKEAWWYDQEIITSYFTKLKQHINLYATLFHFSPKSESWKF